MKTAWWFSQDGTKAANLGDFMSFWIMEFPGAYAQWVICGSPRDGSMNSMIDGPFASIDHARGRLREIVAASQAVAEEPKWG